MSYPMLEIMDSLKEKQKARARERNEGLDMNVCYLVPKQLAQMAGRPLHFVHSEIEKGHLAAAYRGHPRTLIHPLESRRWLLSLEEKPKC